MTPQEILLENELVITMINVHHYIPHKDHGNFRQVVAALQQINPSASYRTDCSGCMSEIGRLAQIHLDAYKATLANEKAKFHTFPSNHEWPKQIVESVQPLVEEKKHKGRKPGSKNKPK